MTVQNTGSAAATAVVVTDVLTGQPVTYQTGSLFTVNTGTVTPNWATVNKTDASSTLSPNQFVEAGFDLKILIKTAGAVIRGRNAY